MKHALAQCGHGFGQSEPAHPDSASMATMIATRYDLLMSISPCHPPFVAFLAARHWRMYSLWYAALSKRCPCPDATIWTPDKPEPFSFPDEEGAVLTGAANGSLGGVWRGGGGGGFVVDGHA